MTIPWPLVPLVLWTAFFVGWRAHIWHQRRVRRSLAKRAGIDPRTVI